MKRLLVPLLATGLILALSLTQARERGRRGSPGSGGEGAGSARSETPGEPGRAGADAPPPPSPRFLRGVVFDPAGRPLHRAQVNRLHPLPREVVFCDEEGRYALPLTPAERHVVESYWGEDYGPERRVVVHAGPGDPPEETFRLQPAGYVHGEVLVDGRPVDGASVDLLAGGKVVGGTQTVSGFFTVLEEPPRDTPLELRVEHEVEGYLLVPPAVTYEGKPVALGRLDLTRYSKLSFRLEFPDGTAELDPSVCEASRLFAELVAGTIWSGRFERDRVRAGRYRLAVWEGERKSGLMIGVAVLPGEDQEVVLAVPRGPANCTGRVVDDRGRSVRARLRHLPSEATVECDESGRFRVEVDAGGLACFAVVALWLNGHAWVELARPAGYLLCDTGRPGETQTLSLCGRVLFLGPRGGCVELAGIGLERTAGRVTAWRQELGAGDVVACLSPLLVPGKYRAGRAHLAAGPGRRWAFPPESEWEAVTVEALGMTLFPPP